MKNNENLPDPKTVTLPGKKPKKDNEKKLKEYIRKNGPITVPEINKKS